MLSVATRDELAADLAEAERSRVPDAPADRRPPRYRRRRRLRDPADQHPPAGRRRRPGDRPQGRPVVGGHAEDDGRRRARLRPPAGRHGGVRGQRRSRPGRFLFPRVEVEVGFILADDLPGAGCTEDDVLAATAAFAPSIELIDTRIKDWKIALCDTIADNASSAGYVLGKERVSPKDIDIQGHRRGADPQRRGGRRGPQRRRAGQSRSPRWPGWRARWTASVCGCGPATSCCRVRAPGPSTARPATSSSPTSPGWVQSGCLSNKRSTRHGAQAGRARSPSSGRATSAPTCCTSCCVRSGSSRAG